MSGESNIENETFNLKIKYQYYELSVSGSLEYLRANIDDIMIFVEDMNQRLNIDEISETEPPTPEEISVAPVEEVPVIRVTRRTMDNILSLFTTDWGRTPRSSAEVARALEVNAVPDSNVSVYLRRLVQRGNLRRITREGRYHYIILPDEE